MEDSIMGSVTHLRTTVLPGKKIEVPAPDYDEGDTVDIAVVWRDTKVARRRSALEILDSLAGGGLFKTAEEVDRYIARERNSWDS
jgi:hypothetical protein